jgi:hypothetical protein
MAEIPIELRNGKPSKKASLRETSVVSQKNAGKNPRWSHKKMALQATQNFGKRRALSCCKIGIYLMTNMKDMLLYMSQKWQKCFYQPHEKIKDIPLLLWIIQANQPKDICNSGNNKRRVLK